MACEFQIMDKPEDGDVDYESDIDKWVIDKEELNRLLIQQDQCSEIKSIDKENIYHCKGSSDKNSLRRYRIRKDVLYQDDSSESDSDSKRVLPVDIVSTCPKKKRKLLKLPCTSKQKELPKSKANQDASLNNSYENVSLTPEEISVVLSEIDENSESSKEKREKLNLIENVYKLNAGKDDNNKSMSLLKKSFTCITCSSSYQSQEDLQCHQDSHRRPSLAIANVNQDKPIKKSINRLFSHQINSDFIDTFKSHLLKHKYIGLNEMEKGSKLDKNSHKGRKTANKTHSTDMKILICSICSYRSTKVLKYKTHEILFHRDVNDLNCEYCDYQTASCVTLATHMQTHLLNCPLCEFQCLGENDFNTHYKKYHLHLKCSKCDYSCNSRREFKHHLKQHLPTNNFICDLCGLAFIMKPQLRTHMKTHAVLTQKCPMTSHTELLECDICKSKFTKKNVLAHHLKIHCKQVFKCKECDSVFSKKHCLKLHMRIHQTKELKCKHCHFKTNSSKDISKHNCIDKLYNVQKRSLNFQREHNESLSENNSSNLTKTTKENADTMQNAFEICADGKESGNIVKLSPPNQLAHYSESRIKTQVLKSKGNQKYNKKQYSSNQDNTTDCAFKNQCYNPLNIYKNALRQNLPSRMDKEPNCITKKNNNGGKCHKRKRGRPRKTVTSKSLSIKRQIHNVKGNLLCKSISKQPTSIVQFNHYLCQRNDHKTKNLAKKNYYLNDLDCLKIMFGKKSSLSNILTEPVRFNSGQFVECYYQNQPVSIPLEHLDSHFRQRPLLSCRLCRYKTNSQQLLQRHIAENHSWDPTTIHALFS